MLSFCEKYMSEMGTTLYLPTFFFYFDKILGKVLNPRPTLLRSYCTYVSLAQQ